MFKPMVMALALGVGMAAVSGFAGAAERQDWMAQIRSLSAEQVDNYLAGRGMGLAKAAELNRYPGPQHVLDLAAELDLSQHQRHQSQRLFDAMQSQARALGEEILGAYARLEAQFAAGTVNAQVLARHTTDIGRLEGELRRVHLAAHLEQAQILEAAQIDRYVQLRGHHRGGHPNPPGSSSMSGHQNHKQHHQH